MKVLVLAGAYHHALLLLGIKALLVAAHHQNAVFHQMAVLLILGALHLVLLRNDRHESESKLISLLAILMFFNDSCILDFLVLVLVGVDPSMISELSA